jgi:hypothetical protein
MECTSIRDGTVPTAPLIMARRAAMAKKRKTKTKTKSATKKTARKTTKRKKK